MSHGPVNEKGELLELRHEAVPGYRTAFYIAFVVGVLYLTALFLMG
jgi:hypothetical protein